MDRKTPYQELTDAANEKILGTLTERAWAKLSIATSRAEWIKKVGLAERIKDPAKREAAYAALPAPMTDVLHHAWQSSGSIGGEHRKDLTTAVQAAKAPRLGLVATTGDLGGDAKAERGL